MKQPQKLPKPKPTKGTFATLGSFSKLSDEQQNLIKNKKIEGEHPANEWINLLQEVVEHDLNNDAARAKFTTIMSACGIGMFISFFIIGVFPPILFLTALLLIVLIISAIFYYKLKRSDVPNFIRLYMFPLIEILKEESKEIAPIRIRAFLGKKIDKAFLVRTIPNANRGYPKVNTFFYQVPFLEIETILADGSRLSVEMKDLIRQRAITKRNPRGKIKSKTKYKVKATYDITVGFPKKVYELNVDTGGRATTGMTDAKVKMKEKEKRNDITIRKRQIFLTPDYVPELPFLLGVIASGYQKIKIQA